ncbi:MAG: XRE family transcriptional regulator [Ruminococcus sp.]
MPKNATKAANNVFYKARSRAASFNDHLTSREGAAEEIGIERTRLARIELGSLTPYPEEVLLMADAYKAPELANHFCSHDCPLGKRTVAPAEIENIDRITVKMIAALSSAEKVQQSILEIVGDGEVTQAEKPTLQGINELLDQFASIAQEMRIWITKNL